MVTESSTSVPEIAASPASITESVEPSNRRLVEIGLHAAGLAHDLSNALSAIAGFSMFAQEAAGMDCPSRPFLIRIEEGVSLAIGLCRQLTECTVTRQTDRDECDINCVVKDTLRTISAKTAHATLAVNLSESGLLASANAIHMAQVIMNLVLNAADALGESGGRIEVSTELELVLGAVSLANEPVEVTDGTYVRIDVRDNGRGMSDSVKAHLFEPFFTTKANGHGIGLSSVASIIRTYCGAITVNSALGVGTRFSVYIPAVPAQVVSHRNAA